MARLPVVGSDDGTWGTVLNDYLSQQHGAGGEHSSITVPGAALATTDVFSSKISTDTSYRYIVNADGGLEWGAGGASAPDVNLYRSAADVLKTDDQLHSAADITARPGGTTAVSIGARGPASEAGIAFYGDTVLYRDAADTLATDDIFRIKRGATNSEALGLRVGAETQNRYYVRGDGQTWWGDGTAAQDTNLYRSAADTLKTDDTFEALVLKQNGTAVADINHTHAIDHLTDVSITTPADDQVLVYDSTTSQWINAASPGGGGGSATFVGVAKWELGV